MVICWCYRSDTAYHVTYLFDSEEYFCGPDGMPCGVLWRLEALDCSVLIPPETWNGLTCNLPCVGFEPQTSSIWEPTLYSCCSSDRFSSIWSSLFLVWPSSGQLSLALLCYSGRARAHVYGYLGDAKDTVWKVPLRGPNSKKQKHRSS